MTSQPVADFRLPHVSPEPRSDDPNYATCESALRALMRVNHDPSLPIGVREAAHQSAQGLRNAITVAKEEAR